MRKLWLLAASLSLLLVAKAPTVAHAQDASVVATCGTLSLPTGYAVAPLTQDQTGTLCTSPGGGGGGAVTVADGADVGEGATTAAAATAGSTGSVNAKLRLVTTQLNTINTTLGTPLQAGGNVVVTGTVPLPTLAATSTKQSDGSQKTQIVDGSGNVIASTSNNLNVQCANCSGSGASAVDEASFTAGTSVMAPVGVFYQTTATSNPLTTGQQGMIQGTANRAAFVNLRTGAGVETGIAAAPLQVSLANTGTNATAVKVDGSAVTQPISASSLPLPTGAMGSTGGTVGIVAGSALMGKVGIDQTTPGTTNLVALAANQSVNVAQMNGVTTTMGNGVAGTGVQRVAIASDNSAIAGVGAGATGSAVPANASYLGTQQSAVLKGVTGCDTHAFYDASDNGKKTVVAGVSAKKIYVCGYIMATGGTATNLSLTSGTGTDCVTTSTAITPAFQLVANDRIGANSPFWNGLITLANADNLCVNASAGNAHQVEIWYTVQ